MISQKNFGFSLLKNIQSELSTGGDPKDESRLTGESSALFRSRCEQIRCVSIKHMILSFLLNFY